MNNKSIILLGIKHCGKSSQGKLLSKELNCPCIDIDEKITELTGKTPRQIYNESGVTAFMQKEEEACKEIASLYKDKQIIISTGGGICDNPPALEILSSLGTFIYLKVAEKLSCDRILNKAQKISETQWQDLPAYISSKNPKSEEEIRTIFHDFYIKRNELYSKIADHTIELQNTTKEENCKLILNYVK